MKKNKINEEKILLREAKLATGNSTAALHCLEAQSQRAPPEEPHCRHRAMQPQVPGVAYMQKTWHRAYIPKYRHDTSDLLRVSSPLNILSAEVFEMFRRILQLKKRGFLN